MQIASVMPIFLEMNWAVKVFLFCFFKEKNLYRKEEIDYVVKVNQNQKVTFKIAFKRQWPFLAALSANTMMLVPSGSGRAKTYEMSSFVKSRL